MNRFALPIMSIIYFVLAVVWTFGAIVTFGQTHFFWLFLLMIPANIFAGIKMMNR